MMLLIAVKSFNTGGKMTSELATGPSSNLRDMRPRQVSLSWAVRFSDKTTQKGRRKLRDALTAALPARSPREAALHGAAS
jgi:hypothetical protein